MIKVKNNVTQFPANDKSRRDHFEATRRSIVKRRLTLTSTVFVGILCIALFFIGNQYMDNESAQKELAKAQSEYETLVDKEKSLSEQVEQLNDDDYIAKIARSEYYLSKEDEIIFNIPEEKKDKENKE